MWAGCDRFGRDCDPPSWKLVRSELAGSSVAVWLSLVTVSRGDRVQVREPVLAIDHLDGNSGAEAVKSIALQRLGDLR